MKPKKKDWPCMDCTERVPGCHGSCEKYLEAKATQTTAEAARKRKNHILDSYTVDQIKKVKDRPGGLVKNYRPKGAG